MHIYIHADKDISDPYRMMSCLVISKKVGFRVEGLGFRVSSFGFRV